MVSDQPPAYNSFHNVNTDVENEQFDNSENEQEFNNSFADKTTRIAFIQKVLSIKLLQLILVIIVMVIFALCDWWVSYTIRRSGAQIIILSIVVFLATTGLLMYCTKARYENPYRYAFLVMHPISLTVLICFPGLYCRFLVSLAVAFVGYVAAIFSVLLYSVFALNTKLEFAVKHCIFLAGVVQLVMFASLVPLVYVEAFGVLYLSFALCLNYVYIFWDLEFMTSMKYWHHVTPGDFIDAALNLHVDYYYMYKNHVMPHINKVMGNTTEN